MTMLRYGGIAGATDRVSVEASGEVTVIGDRSPTPRTRMLSPDELARLRTALERSDIATLQRNYLDPRAADAYQYDVPTRASPSPPTRGSCRPACARSSTSCQSCSSRV